MGNVRLESEKIMLHTFQTLTPFVDILLNEQNVDLKVKETILDGINDFFMNWSEYVWPNLQKWLKNTKLENPAAMVNELCNYFPFLNEFKSILEFTLESYFNYWEAFYSQVNKAKRNLE